MTFKRLIYLLEKNRHTRNLLPSSESKRRARAENVKILSISKYTPSTTPSDKPLLRGWKRWEIELESQEQTENRCHSAYVVLNNNNNVSDVFCSCADFQFLWRYPLVKNDMASWETYPEYKDIETHGPHTKKETKITNPNFDKRLCKHLIKIFDYLNI